MKKLITLLALVSTFWASAHNTIPLCGYNGVFTFKMQAGNTTTAHVVQINPITLQHIVGGFDSVLNFPANSDFNLLVPYSGSITIWVTWGDGVTNMASSNIVSCAPLAVRSSVVSVDKLGDGYVNVTLLVEGEGSVNHYLLSTTTNGVKRTKLLFFPDALKKGKYSFKIKL